MLSANFRNLLPTAGTVSTPRGRALNRRGAAGLPPGHRAVRRPCRRPDCDVSGNGAYFPSTGLVPGIQALTTTDLPDWERMIFGFTT